MARPATRAAEDKVRIVLAVLRSEVTIAEAARREAVSQTSIANWRDQFLDGGQQAVAAGGPTKPTTREQRWTPSTVRSAEPTMRTRDEVRSTATICRRAR